MRRALFWAFALLAFCFFTTASVRAAHAWDQPPLTRPVTDMAGVMSPEAVRAIEAGLRSHQKVNGDQIAVLLLATTGSEPIEDFAIRVASTWRGGEAGRDNGVLVVLAVNDRRSRIEVGYGLESKLTDALAKEVLDGARPLLKSEDYDGAIAQIVNGVLGRLGSQGSIQLPTIRSVPVRVPPASPLTHQSPPPAYSPPSNSSGDYFLWFAGFIGVVLLSIVFLSAVESKLGTTFSGSGYSSNSSTSPFGSPWSSSSSSDSSSGSSRSSFGSSRSSSSSFGSSSSSGSSYRGGGGSFGGGGASSSW